MKLHLLDYLKIDKADLENTEYIKESILKNSKFEGSTIWILICAILIASLGLNSNSTSVIIGAMLISPLMSPIIGIGFGLGTYDFTLVKNSFKFFLTFVGTSLVASFIFFSISPITEADLEIIARTRPTISDVMVAFFGGLAGMLATMAKQKGNVIPGAAIATALMPPLCVAGFGIASGNWGYFAGALYLLIINTVFIAFATLLTVRILKIPIYHQKDLVPSQIKRANLWTWIILGVTFLPSIYLGYVFFQEDQFVQNANKFIKAEAQFANSYILGHNISPQDKTIEIVFGGSKVSENQRQILTSKLRTYGLKKAKIVVRQGFSLDDDNEGVKQVGQLSLKINELTRENISLRSELEQVEKIYQMPYQIREELKSLYPSIMEVYMAEKIEKKVQDTTILIPDFVWIKQSAKITKEQKESIRKWLQTRIHADIVVQFNF